MTMGSYVIRKFKVTQAHTAGEAAEMFRADQSFDKRQCETSRQFPTQANTKLDKSVTHERMAKQMYSENSRAAVCLRGFREASATETPYTSTHHSLPRIGARPRGGRRGRTGNGSGM